LDLTKTTSKNLWDTPKGEGKGENKNNPGIEETNVLMYVNIRDWEGQIVIKNAKTWGSRAEPRKGGEPGCKVEKKNGGKDIVLKPTTKNSNRHCTMWIKATEHKQQANSKCYYRTMCGCRKEYKEEPFWCDGSNCENKAPYRHSGFDFLSRSFYCQENGANDDSEMALISKRGYGSWHTLGKADPDANFCEPP